MVLRSIRNRSAVIVAVAFACVRPECVTIRGVVFCPEMESGLLLSDFRDGPKQALDDRAVKERGTGRQWVKKHFDLVDPPAPRVEFAPLAFKRDFAFARVRNIAIGTNRLIVRFDVFVGPGEYPLPVNATDKARPSPRAIHGFADIAHYPVFDNEIAHGKGGPMSGQAALCLIEKPNDLLGDRWRLRSDGILQVVPKNEVGAVLHVEPTAHWRKRRMRFNPNADAGDEVGDPLERSLVFRARLVVQLAEARDKKVVGL